VKGATRTKKTKSKQSYYEVDSLYLKAHYPLLARRHGWSWRWSAREIESFACRGEVGGFNADDDGRVFTATVILLPRCSARGA
jgi:hypothetical protein